MSDLMRLIPYEQLLDWVLTEYETKGSIFGVSKVVKHEDGKALPIFKERIESPFGPAAGPNTQLAQNIIAAYAAGSRFFELKTVQVMDGRELAACVPKPCITAGDECYNCEWSTELEVGQAFQEYVKAWFICRILAKEFGLGDPDGFVFNMSVGYDLKGIQTPKVDGFIEGMKDASGTDIFKECMAASIAAAESGRLKKADRAFCSSIPARVSDSITESTLHGCPPDEIERIAHYLITEKHLNTFIKCNPTILGYEFARKTLNGLGFDYIAFDDHHFLEDLQWADAVPMFERLQKLCDEKGLEFGLKLTNTFPVDVKAGELPSSEMYMSGRSLFPLTVEVARRVSEQFDGKLRISYSGGADFFNIDKLFNAGIWPITMATTVLKPGGYQRMSQIAGKLADCGTEAFAGVDVEQVKALAAYALADARYRKPIKGLPSRKMEAELPLIDCFTAPCTTNCPINQDIPAYLQAMEEGRTEDALKIILEKNALPFMTGTLCPHTCTDRCMRSHYEEGLRIREMKLAAAEGAFEKVLPELQARGKRSGRKAAVIGGGPAGLAAASFLSRAGVAVTVFEKNDQVGGVPRYVIPDFRITADAIARDAKLCAAYGAEFVTGREIASVAELKEEGYTDVIVAVGAWEEGRSALAYGEALDALAFLKAAKEDPAALSLGEDVVVIGGGNTAMDVARAAKRIPGVKNVRLVYRRTRRYMPADEEELQMAVDDGIEFMELLAPKGVENGVLSCSVMKLGEPDASGRRSPVDTGETVEVPASAVITAVGERVNTSLYSGAGAELTAKGLPVVDDNMKTTVDGLYAVGDCRRGPATIVKAIADAQCAAAAIVASIDGASPEDTKQQLFGGCEGLNKAMDVDSCKAKKGVLEAAGAAPDRRCLGCAAVCEVCVDVCPNRANIAVKVPGLAKEQIVHVDGMCNECGNCAVFCPYSGRPYKDKLTLYWSEEDFADSENQGFLPLADGSVKVRLGNTVKVYRAEDEKCGLYEPIRKIILAVKADYAYLIK
ncbi:MAG: putative selenate reductase subunit YgfK [Lachnospiraceae bacterium]|nr:putative selenate reductase subunit YgfK [Lachnospiraceae bacterium]